MKGMDHHPVWMILTPKYEFPIYGGTGGSYRATAVTFVDAETGKWKSTESG
jgi:hypothetical protein